MDSLIVIENGLIAIPGLFFIQIRLLVLLLLVAVATFFDWRQRRIPNLLVFPGIAVGLLIQWLSPYDLGIGAALKGMGTAFAMLIPLYAMRAMGAGDVKLMAMVGIFVGGVGNAFATVIYTLLCGGALALFYVLLHGSLGRLIESFKNMFWGMAIRVGSGGGITLERSASIGKVPYAFAIAGGTIAHVVLNA